MMHMERSVLMREKDITEKMLADYNDVFADIVNVLLFDGRQVVDEHRLVSTKDRQQFKADGEIHEEERDVSKIVQGNNVRVAFVGFEHQTDADADEPFRVIAYDGVSYKAQLISGDKQRYPVVTKDNRFEEAQRISKDGERNMCDVFDKYEAKGKAEGRAEGIVAGKVELLCEDGRTPAEIAERLNITVEEVNRIIAAES